MTYSVFENSCNTSNNGRCGSSCLLLPSVSLGLWQYCGDISPIATRRQIVRLPFDKEISYFDLANNYCPPAASRPSREAFLKSDQGMNILTTNHY